MSKVNIPSSHTPVISNLRYSPESVTAKQGDTVSITANIDFADSGGDIATLKISSPGIPDMTTATTGTNGQTNGTVTGILTVSADEAGMYPYQIWIVDSKGNSSNKLSGTFELIIGSASANAPWPMFKHETSHTGQSPFVGPRIIF